MSFTEAYRELFGVDSNQWIHFNCHVVLQNLPQELLAVDPTTVSQGLKFSTNVENAGDLYFEVVGFWIIVREVVLQPFPTRGWHHPSCLSQGV